MTTTVDIDTAREAARAAVAHLPIAGQLTALIHAVDHTIATGLPPAKWEGALELTIKQLLEGIHFYHPNRA
jgi:hypothetical protein